MRTRNMVQLPNGGWVNGGQVDGMSKSLAVEGRWELTLEFDGTSRYIGQKLTFVSRDERDEWAERLAAAFGWCEQDQEGGENDAEACVSADKVNELATRWVKMAGRGWHASGPAYQATMSCVRDLRSLVGKPQEAKPQEAKAKGTVQE